MADCLQLVHFHLGSQITNIRNIKDALTEAARVYTELHRVGAGVKYIDVGGGLGIDYDGSQTDFESSRQLHPAGIRQRRRLPHQERLRRGRRPAPDHHLRVGPGGRRLSQHAGLRRARRVQLRPLHGAAGDPGRRPAADHRPVRHPPRPVARRTCSRATTTPCRRWTRRSTCSTSATCRSSSGPWPSGCSGRCAARSCSMVRELDYVPEELQGPGVDAVGHLFLQLLGLPVDAR